MKQRSSLKYSAIFFVVMEVFLCNVTTLYAGEYVLLRGENALDARKRVIVYEFFLR